MIAEDGRKCTKKKIPTVGQCQLIEGNFFKSSEERTSFLSDGYSLSIHSFYSGLTLIVLEAWQRTDEKAFSAETINPLPDSIESRCPEFQCERAKTEWLT